MEIGGGTVQCERSRRPRLTPFLLAAAVATIVVAFGPRARAVAAEPVIPAAGPAGSTTVHLPVWLIPVPPLPITLPLPAALPLPPPARPERAPSPIPEPPRPSRQTPDVAAHLVGPAATRNTRRAVVVSTSGAPQEAPPLDPQPATSPRLSPRPDPSNAAAPAPRPQRPQRPPRPPAAPAPAVPLPASSVVIDAPAPTGRTSINSPAALTAATAFAPTPAESRTSTGAHPAVADSGAVTSNGSRAPPRSAALR